MPKRIGPNNGDPAAPPRRAGQTAGVKSRPAGDVPDDIGSTSRKLDDAEISRRLTEVMDAAGARAGLDRARVIVVRNGRVAAIERFRRGRQYWVMPGGGVEEGETIEQAALREAVEELGVPVRLGRLRAVVRDQAENGLMQRHWCFDAAIGSEDIKISGGPEFDAPPESGTYKAVWLGLDELQGRQIHPASVGRLLADNRGVWPDQLIQAFGPKQRSAAGPG